MSWVKQIFVRRRLYSDLSEEIQEHLEEKVEGLIASGMSREEALAAGRREFGNALLLEERSRDVWRWPALDTLFTEFRYAVRQLRKAPAFTTICIFILALGIGANTLIFTFVYALLLRPLPYPHPERLAALMTHTGATLKSGDHLTEEDDSVDGETWELVSDNVPAVIPAAYVSVTGVNLQVGKTVRYVQEQRVSAHYFEVLGITPFIGRGLSEEEDRPQGPNAVILSYALWKSLFDLDPEIYGKTILLKGAPHIVVGILPANAQTPQAADLWTPLQPSRTGEGSGDNYGLIMRLRNGMTWQEADAQLRPLHPSYLAEFSKTENGEAWMYAEPLQQDLAEPARLPGMILISAVAFILLIACANLAGLMLVRVLRRSSEMATRLALGATRAAILRQVMMEPFLLVVAGAAAGLIVARSILDFLPRVLAPEMLPVGGISLDMRVLCFAVAISLCTAVLIGTLPAREASRVDLRGAMGPNAWNEAGRKSQRRIRQLLIAGEVALTIVLLSGAGLLIRTLAHLETLPPGFDPSNVMTAQVSLDDVRYHDSATFQNLVRTGLMTMQRIPGVESAAFGLSLPYQRGLNEGIRIADGAQAGELHGSSAVYITPDYFQTLRIPILAGRAFKETDTSQSEFVAIVNVSFARAYFRTEDVVGRHLKATKTGPTLTIVGVVADVTKRPGLQQTAPLTAGEPTYYLPAAQADQQMLNLAHTWFQPSWIVRTQGPIQGLAGEMQKALAEADPQLPFSGVHGMVDLEHQALEHQRTEVLLLSVLAGLALLLSIVGVYGLVSNLVTQRTREIGIRMALGSTLERTMVEIGKSGILAAIWGVVAGLGLTVVAVRFIRSELYGVRPYDAVTFAATLTLLLIAVTLASLAPTRRIANIDPASTLRAE